MAIETDSGFTRELDALGLESVKALREFIRAPNPMPVDIGRAKISANAFNSYARMKATESAREGNFLMLARGLADDKEQFRSFVKLGMPNAPIVRALPAGKK